MKTILYYDEEPENKQGLFLDHFSPLDAVQLE